MGTFQKLDDPADMSIAKMDAGDFWLSPRAGVPPEPDEVGKVIDELIEMDVPGIQFWMSPKRAVN